MNVVRKNPLIILLVCVFGVFLSGCAFQRKEGENWALLRGSLTLCGGDATETTLTGNKGLQTLQDSKKPSFEQKQLLKQAMEDNKDLVQNTQEILGY